MTVPTTAPEPIRGEELRRSEPGGLPWTALRALREGKLEQRLQAITELRGYGAEVIEPVCAALADRDPQVLTAAAGVLAKIGDERAIRPLSEALHRHEFTVHTRLLRREWVVMPLVFAGLLLLLWEGWHRTGAGHIPLTLLNYVVVIWILGRVNLRRVTNETLLKRQALIALVGALQEVTLRCPHTAANTVVSDLRELATTRPGRKWMSPEAQAVAGEAADLIEAATLARRDLPIPISTAAVTALPRAAEARIKEASDLPRPLASEDAEE